MNVRLSVARILLAAALLAPRIAAAGPLKFSDEFLGGEKVLVGRVLRSGETEIQWSAVGVSLDREKGLAMPAEAINAGAGTLPVGTFYKKTSRITVVARILPGNIQGGKNWTGIYLSDAPAGTKSPVTMLALIRGFGDPEAGIFRLARSQEDVVFSSEKPVCKPSRDTPVTLLLRLDLRSNEVSVEIDGQPIYSGAFLDPEGKPYPAEKFAHIGFRMHKSNGAAIDSFDVLIN